MTTYDTASEAVAGLRNEGYTEDFNLMEDCLTCQANKFRIFQDEFMVDATYRLEGNTDPADEAVVYAISSDKHSLKGILVDGYGPSSNPVTEAMVKKLHYRNV